MKKQDGKGNPIYSDKVWNTLLKIGQKLLKMGYTESTKPHQHNFFYKQIEYSENGDTKC